MIATVSTVGALALIGWLIVIGCLVAAAVAGFRGAWVPCLLLVVVAIIAAALLL
jgi:hypothetical protein